VWYRVTWYRVVWDGVVWDNVKRAKGAALIVDHISIAGPWSDAAPLMLRSYQALIFSGRGGRRLSGVTLLRLLPRLLFTVSSLSFTNAGNAVYPDHARYFLHLQVAHTALSY
ncbi:MAG: hypothetical protein ABL893_15290, partial [Hyphomicrobium sp.]